MIELKNITFSYERREQGGLRNINLTVKNGECILLCGRSGCGKTTITRLVNGLIPRFYDGELTGQVVIDGKDIADLTMYEISEKVGSVFQNPRTQFFNTDSDSEIAFGLENQGMPTEELRQRVETTAADLEIQSLRNRSLHALSGGEKQKVAFASVYAMNPDIYLLDEPSSNLDMDAIQDLRKHLKLVKQQGKTILIAEHRLYYLMDVVDRIVYMEQGQIAGIYTPEQFRAIEKDERKRMGLRAVDLHEVHPQFTSPGAIENKILKLQDVGLYYKKQAIVEHINLSAGIGEIIGVVGHNGAGKTTLSRTLCGLHKEASGQFLWNEKPQDRKERLRRSYMVMQDVNHQLFTESVIDEILLGLDNSDVEKATSEAERIMESLHISEFRNAHPMSLSGGQKQRVAIASAIASDKQVIVFDEPTSGLDYRHMKKVAENLQKLSSLGKTLFIVTHDPELIAECCNYFVFIENGKVLWSDGWNRISRERLQQFFAFEE